MLIMCLIIKVTGFEVLLPVGRRGLIGLGRRRQASLGSDGIFWVGRWRIWFSLRRLVMGL